MLDLENMGPLANLEIARRLAARDIGIGRRPFGAPLAPLEAETGLLAGEPVVVLFGVDGHTPGMHLLVTERLGPRFEDLVVVAPRKPFAAAGAGHAQLGFRLVVPGRHFRGVDGPVQKVRPLHVPVGGLRLPLMVLETQRRAGPMGRRPADSLDDPGRKPGEVFRHAPVAAGRAGIEPGQLPETLPLVVDVVFRQITPAGFQSDDTDAFLGQFVGEDAATGARSDNDDDAVVIQFEWCTHLTAPP